MANQKLIKASFLHLKAVILVPPASLLGEPFTQARAVLAEAGCTAGGASTPERLWKPNCALPRCHVPPRLHKGGTGPQQAATTRAVTTAPLRPLRHQTLRAGASEGGRWGHPSGGRSPSRAGVSAPCLSVPAAYPTAYAPISQAFPQQAPIIPQQQREGKGAPRRGAGCSAAPGGPRLVADVWPCPLCVTQVPKAVTCLFITCPRSSGTRSSRRCSCLSAMSSLPKSLWTVPPTRVNALVSHCLGLSLVAGQHQWVTKPKAAWWLSPQG